MSLLAHKPSCFLPIQHPKNHLPDRFLDGYPRFRAAFPFCITSADQESSGRSGWRRTPMLRTSRPTQGSPGGKTHGMADAMSNSSTPGMDPDEPIPDTPAELDEPDLPAPPIESTPEDPGGDPGEEPAQVPSGSWQTNVTAISTQNQHPRP